VSTDGPARALPSVAAIATPPAGAAFADFSAKDASFSRDKTLRAELAATQRRPQEPFVKYGGCHESASHVKCFDPLAPLWPRDCDGAALETTSANFGSLTQATCSASST
jgi:hypothetical protein